MEFCFEMCYSGVWGTVFKELTASVTTDAKIANRQLRQHLVQCIQVYTIL